MKSFINTFYYPFGMPMPGHRIIGGKPYRYKYNGKELQDEFDLNMYDYGARFYDPAVPHFWQIDPLAENYNHQTPYAYAVNNPVYFIDKDGMAPHGPGDPPTNPIAKRIVSNYQNSNNQKPGGDCFAVAKQRFNTAFKQVMGKSVYSSLPANSASTYYNAKSTYNNLFATSTGTHAGWKGISKDLRGTGGAGAIVNAGMGEMVDKQGIWNGDLEPGAVMQVFTSEDGFNDVVNGVDGGDYEGYGHSFIFLNYEYDDDNNISGMNIADQGFQEFVSQDSYEVWFGANITAAPRSEVQAISTSNIKPVQIQETAIDINVN